MTPSTSDKMAQTLAAAEKLTPLQLNGIKLDARHTILTPDYLELVEKQQAAGDTK